VPRSGARAAAAGDDGSARLRVRLTCGRGNGAQAVGRA
jgi:hypothetical protein